MSHLILNKVINSARLQVRPYESIDVASLALNANDKEVWINLPDRFPSPYTYTDAREWINLARTARPIIHFCIAVDGEAAGGIGIFPQDDVHRKTAEIGYWLGKKYWGKGYTTEALQATTSYFFQNFDLVRLYAYVFEWNTGSQRVLEKSGYHLEAVLKQSAFKANKNIDQFLYAKLNENFPDN
jgi:[ribosomal protein S5]-alanine N-acetyltransferase